MPLTEREITDLAAAGVVDAATAARLRAHYRALDHDAAGAPSRLVVVALSLGGVAIAAGLLLFVAANWKRLGPAPRVALVLGLVAACHLAGAWVAPRSRALAMLAHALGTVALGAGIYLTGQIFNLEARWPAAVLLWGLGALGAWALLRDGVQAAFAAVLLPVWAGGELAHHLDRWFPSANADAWLALPAVLLALAYAAAVGASRTSLERRVLAVIGMVALLPFAGVHAWLAGEQVWPLPAAAWLARAGLVALPLALGLALRPKAAGPFLLAAAWAIGLEAAVRSAGGETSAQLVRHVWLAGGALALIAWGVRESEAPRVNAGVTAFVLTVASFYVTNVLDRLGRSLGLVVFGVLLVAGGLAADRVRRRLIARMDGGANGAAADDAASPVRDTGTPQAPGAADAGGDAP